MQVTFQRPVFAYGNALTPPSKFILYTGKFISLSGISDLCGAVARIVMLKGSMPAEGERHSKFLSYVAGARYTHPAVSVLVVAQPSSEVPEELMNYPVYMNEYIYIYIYIYIHTHTR